MEIMQIIFGQKNAKLKFKGLPISSSVKEHAMWNLHFLALMRHITTPGWSQGATRMNISTAWFKVGMMGKGRTIVWTQEITINTIAVRVNNHPPSSITWTWNRFVVDGGRTTKVLTLNLSPPSNIWFWMGMVLFVEQKSNTRFWFSHEKCSLGSGAWEACFWQKILFAYQVDLICILQS